MGTRLTKKAISTFESIKDVDNNSNDWTLCRDVVIRYVVMRGEGRNTLFIIGVWWGVVIFVDKQ